MLANAVSPQRFVDGSIGLFYQIRAGLLHIFLVALFGKTVPRSPSGLAVGTVLSFGGDSGGLAGRVCIPRSRITTFAVSSFEVMLSIMLMH